MSHAPSSSSFMMSPLMLSSYSAHSPGSSSQSSESSAWPAQSTPSLSSSSSSSSCSCSSSPEQTDHLNPPPQQQPQSSSSSSALPLYDQNHPPSSSTHIKQKKRVSFTGVAVESVSEPARITEREGQGRETNSLAPTRQSSLKWNKRVGSAIFELKLSQEEFMRRCYQPAAVYEATF